MYIIKCKNLNLQIYNYPNVRINTIKFIYSHIDNVYH